MRLTLSILRAAPIFTIYGKNSVAKPEIAPSAFYPLGNSPIRNVFTNFDSLSLADIFLPKLVWSSLHTGASSAQLLSRYFQNTGFYVSATKSMEVPYDVPI